jgi:predicted Zn-dependent peptidase
MFKKFTLPNGLRVLLVPQKGAKAVTLLVLVEAGSKYETKEQNGISHFLEHMVFKGSKKRPTPLAIATELDRIGGESNAFTSHEYTGYWIKADASQFDTVLDLISDIYLNPLFNENEIEKEKNVVIEEMNMYFDLPQRHVWDLWLELLYGDQPAGWPVIGNKETIRRLKRDDILKYVNEHYRAPHTLVTISGDFDEGVVEKIDKYFIDISGGYGKPKPAVNEFQERPAVKLYTKKTDQTHLVLGVRAFSIFDERRFPLTLLNTVLGSGMSSRLFQRLREELGMAYYVGSHVDLFTDHGYFAAYAGVDTNRIQTAINVILEEFKRLRKVPIPEEELRKSKDHLRGTLILNLETTDELASFYGPQEILKKEIHTPEELLAKIERLTPEDLQQVAQEIFVEKNLNLAVIGPINEPKLLEQSLHLN